MCCWRASGFKNNLRLSNILVELALAANVVFSGKSRPLELAQQLVATYVCIEEGYRLRPLDRLCHRRVL